MSSSAMSSCPSIRMMRRQINPEATIKYPMPILLPSTTYAAPHSHQNSSSTPKIISNHFPHAPNTSSQSNSRKESRSRKSLRNNTLDINISTGRVLRTPHLQQNKASTNRRVEFNRTLALISLNEESGMRCHQLSSHSPNSFLGRILSSFCNLGECDIADSFAPSQTWCADTEIGFVPWRRVLAVIIFAAWI